MPLRYALRYGTYMVPHIRHAPSAARIPLMARGDAAAADVPPPCMLLNPRRMAAMTIATEPRMTRAMILPLAPSNSRKSTLAHRSPTSVFAFHKGNATARPTSRIAKTVSVLATAQSAPASSAQTIRCFLLMRSAQT